MKKNLIISLSAAIVLSVSAYAHMHQDSSNMNNMQMNQQMKNTQRGMNNGMMKGNYSNQNMMGNSYGHMSGNGMMGQGMMGQGMMGQGMMNHGMMNHNMMAHSMVLPKIMMLDLSTKQFEKISEILSSENKKLSEPLDAFSNSSFDKKKYLKAIQNNKDKMIEVHADKLSKIYSLLTKKQKEDLKKVIEVQKMMKNRNMNHMMQNMHR